MILLLPGEVPVEIEIQLHVQRTGAPEHLRDRLLRCGHPLRPRPQRLSGGQPHHRWWWYGTQLRNTGKTFERVRHHQEDEERQI